uniref:Diaminopimelate decarboxylase n=1 Tax=Strigomonas galati TaxID=1003336 RepID=U5KN30_9TRYP|nr:diaminopimelate decarboxylase [Strigomonas galati]
MWIEKAMLEVAAAKLFPEHTHLFLVSRSELRRRMTVIRESFEKEARAAGGPHPPTFLHAFAVKANPMQSVLETAKAAGFGAETASIGEFKLAERIFTGADAHKIVFDSPAKTLEELHHALQTPCYLNVDNFAELERIIALQRGGVAPHLPALPTITATVGIRVNPQTVERTDNAALATGGKISKFGVGLHDGDNKERIVDYFQRYHDTINLKMLHVHSGSQGLSLDTMVTGVQAILSELAEDPRMAPLVDVVDIGGGFPVDFSSDDETLTVADYARELRERVPGLFTAARPRLIITEFGRTVAAKSGVLLSRVEYVKESGGRQVVLQHAGADLAVRTVWQPEKWPLRVEVYDKTGKLKAQRVDTQISEVPTDVGGPCCNSGCMLTRAAALPADIKPLEDVVLVHDVGGYYHSAFSLYNLRQMPACYVYDADATPRLWCVKKPQPVEDTLKLFETDV